MSDGAALPVTPFRQILLKIHSRCNLACSYCYVYRHPDQSWRAQPRVMTAATIDRIAERTAEHARAHALSRIRVVLHGGEPLLAGVELIDRASTAVRAAAAPQTTVDLRLTTNGVLLDKEFLALFREHRISVAVSLDGPARAHDRERLFPNGQGSHDRVAQGLRLLAQDRHRENYAGLLCTIDLRNDPLEVYEHLLRFEPPEIDFLLPHGNWSTPPVARTADPTVTPYAQWLIQIFDRWFDAPRRETRVRTFESIIRLLLGGQSRTEAFGLAPVDLLTVETDGSLEQSDTLKSVASGASATGMDIWRNSFDDALRHPGVRARHIGLAALAPACRRCPLVAVCGGGMYPHRYRAGSGFTNPSVYCPDLYRLIQHIDCRIQAMMTMVAPVPAPTAGPAR